MIVYADPAWSYNSKSAVNNSKGSKIKKITKHYNTMSLQDIKSIPVKSILDDHAVCFLWVTDSHLSEGLEVLKAWGFKYKTIAFNWVKLTTNSNICSNVAPYTMKNCELCLLGTKGTINLFKMSYSVKQLVQAIRTKHSKKPKEVRNRIYEMYGNLPRIELFARKKYKGWDVWGNEVKSDIVLI